MLENIEAIIFDLDGTLVDSMWVWTAIDDEFLGKYGLTQPENFHEGMEGKSYSDNRAADSLELSPNLPHTLEELMEEWYGMAYEKYAKSKLILKKEDI